MNDSFFVSASTTRPFYIKGRPGYWPELRGRYKPFGVEGRLQWMQRAAQTPPEQLVELETTTVAGQLAEWNAGAINPAQVKKLDGDLFLRLREIVCYGGDSDIDPTLTQQPISEDADETAKKNES